MLFEVHLEGTWRRRETAFTPEEIRNYIELVQDQLHPGRLSAWVNEADWYEGATAHGEFTLDIDVDARSKDEAMKRAKRMLVAGMRAVMCRPASVRLL